MVKSVKWLKGVSHIVYFEFQKKKQDSIQGGILSTMKFPNLTSVFAETLSAVREQQKQDFAQKQD